MLSTTDPSPLMPLIILNIVILLKTYSPEIKQAIRDFRHWHYHQRRRPK